VTFFLRRETDTGAGLVITGYGTGADPVSPFTITGLEAGMQYRVYAVVTDKVYAEAETVSESGAAMAVAG
jgi:L-asparaginase/Glu-tRNA(Gln) amidotransferase subunit D